MFAKELLVLGLVCALGGCLRSPPCEQGFVSENRKCVDMNECDELPEPCGNHASCFNTNGSFYCQCQRGFTNVKGLSNFTGLHGQCKDVNECLAVDSICGPTASCSNLIGSYRCICRSGYISTSTITGTGTSTSVSKDCKDIDECEEAENEDEDICGREGTCENVPGGFWCKCPVGFTNYGVMRTPCSQLNCDSFTATQHLGGLADLVSMMRNSCLSLSEPAASGGGKVDGDVLLEKFFTATEDVLSSARLVRPEDVTELLGAVENSIRLIGPQLRHNRTRMETTETDVEIATQRGNARPTGPIRLSTENATLDTDWTTAAGRGTYPGFALAALLSYKNLDRSVSDRSFDELRGFGTGGVTPSFQVSSRVVSVVVSNPSTQSLSHPVVMTFRHLQGTATSSNVSYVCAFWTDRGNWSTAGCSRRQSNATHTVCACTHLSSFAVLMALYPMEHTFGLVLITKLGLVVSLLCLVLSILTFRFCRSIQGTRTTIHLHLCICLFMADLVFLAGISQTTPEGGCRFVAALLHLFFLGVFAWMLLEGVQLYRMVVLVFNASIRPLYLYLVGYGTPLVIVIISAIIRPRGYGTDRHCWLSLTNGLIWSFFGPVCVIIFINVFFFIVTVWRLVQKFSSLNPDLSRLNKIRAFTVTAIAQMCILGLMWVFGAFLFDENNMAAAYIFTILNSLQGALVFFMHCLLCKQVREEYAHFFSCICKPQKKSYSDFSSTNPSSSQSQASRSGQHTGELQI